LAGFGGTAFFFTGALGALLAEALGGALLRAGGRNEDLVLDGFTDALPFAAVFALLLRPVRSSFSAMLLDPSLQKRGLQLLIS